MNDSTIRLNTYQRLIQWQARHNSMGFDIIRMFLGLALMIRGIMFLMDPEAILVLAGDGEAVARFSSVVAWTHTVGGLLLLLGLLTRVAAAIQLPILVNAVFFVHLEWGFAQTNQSLELSLLVLFLLAVILIYGAGRYSLDYRLFGGHKVVDL